jgi:hypothetical protein
MIRDSPIELPRKGRPETRDFGSHGNKHKDAMRHFEVWKAEAVYLADKSDVGEADYEIIYS